METRAMTFGEFFGEILKKEGITEESLPVASSFLSKVKEGRAHLPGDIFWDITIKFNLPEEVKNFLNRLWRNSVEERIILPGYIEKWLANGRRNNESPENMKPEQQIEEGLEKIIVSASSISRVFMELLQKKGLDKKGPAIKKEVNRVFFQTIQQIAFTLKLGKEEEKQFVEMAVSRGIL